MFQSVHSTLNQALEYKSVPKKFLTDLTSQFHQNPQSFSRALQSAILQLLPLFKKNPNSERGLKAILAVLDQLKKVAALSTDEKTNNSILRSIAPIIRLVIKGCEAKDKTIRLASAWLTERILSLKLREVLDFPDVLFNKIIDATRSLIRDKSKQIRYFSVNLAAKLFLIEELVQMITCDERFEIRRQAVSLVPLTPETTSVVISKLRDKDETVRYAACKRLTEFTFASLSAGDRLMIISRSISDRSEKVREECKKFISGYFSQVPDNVLKSEETESYIALLEFMQMIDLTMVNRNLESEVTRCLRFICKEIMKVEDLSKLLENELLPGLMSVFTTPGKGNMGLLNSSSLYLLRVVCEVLKEKDEKVIEKILPDVGSLSQLCFYYKDKSDLFMLQNMLLLTFCTDLGEEFTRAQLLDTYIELCRDLPITLAEGNHVNLIDKAYQSLHRSEFFCRTSQQIIHVIIGMVKSLLKEYDTEFSRRTVELINEIRDPLMAPLADDDMMVIAEDTQRPPSLLEKKQALADRISSMDDEVEALENEQERLIELGDYKEALKIKSRMDELVENISSCEREHSRIDDQVKSILERSLILTCEMLRHSRQGEVDPNTSELVSTLIYPGLKATSEPIRCLAMECLGLFCLLKAEPCLEYMFMFKIILEKKNDEYMEFIALKAVLDFFMVFDFLKEEYEKGCTIVDDDSDYKVSAHTLLKYVISYLDSNDINIRSLVVEGLAKLMLLERMPDCKAVLAKLMLSFFDPNSPNTIKQSLHIFFTHYSLLSDKNAENLADAFKMVMSVIVYFLNNKDKPITKFNLSALSLNKIFSFVFTMLNPEFLKQNAKFDVKQNYQFDMFYFLTRATELNIAGSESIIYPRMFVQTFFAAFNPKQVCVADSVLNKLKDGIKDKAALKCVTRSIELVKKRIEETSRVKDVSYEESLEQAFQQSYKLGQEFRQKVDSDDSMHLLTPMKENLKSESSEDPIEFSGDEEINPPQKRQASTVPPTCNKKLKSQ